MTTHEKFMQRCLTLAKGGEGTVSPNPLVGCVIVRENKIIGEGFHRTFGGPHAEVLAIASVKDKDLLTGSTLFVSLEPCSHHGKTPPCTDLIIRSRIPRVVVGMIDPFPAVAGKGVEQLRLEGIEVETGILEKECREMNRRFVTFHVKKRPYIFLKWAMTSDGYMDAGGGTGKRGYPVRISGPLSHLLVHRQRTTEDAVLVGTRTAWKDNPFLTARDWSGKNPVRIVIDRKLQLPSSLHLFDGEYKTIVFNEVKSLQTGNILWEKLESGNDLTAQIVHKLYEWNIQSLVVEGGADTLRKFIANDIWDEAHIYTGTQWYSEGVKAPEIKGEIIATEVLEESRLTVIRNLTQQL
jgi:diaminohydroxyphosphoribosylaminopyrimidine deaminase/5-amino-6-(5-phosphoribosylamino)uracil reductase